MGRDDPAEIAQVIARYAKALDDKDYALLDTLFTPDAITHYRMDDLETNTSYPEMRKLFDDFNRVFYLTSHMLGAPIITVDADSASAETKLIATHVQIRRADQSRSSWFVYGFYRDQLRRSDSGWRIHERFFRSTHTEGALLPPDEVEHFEKPPWR